MGKAVGAERFPLERDGVNEQTRIDRAAAALRAKGGDGALLDAAGIAAAFAAMTIMVDATGHWNPFIPKVRPIMEKLVRMRKKVGPCLIPLMLFAVLLLLLGLCAALWALLRWI